MVEGALGGERLARSDRPRRDRLLDNWEVHADRVGYLGKGWRFHVRREREFLRHFSCLREGSRAYICCWSLGLGFIKANLLDSRFDLRDRCGGLLRHTRACTRTASNGARR